MATDAQRKATAKANGETINGMLNRLVDKEIERVAKKTHNK